MYRSYKFNSAENFFHIISESHPENENDEPEGTESSSSLTGFVEVENLAMKTDSE